MRNGRIAAVVGAVVCLLGVAPATSSATEDPKCRHVAGRFTLQAYTEGCTSPVGLCATGTYHGGIQGTNVFVGTTLVPTSDTPTTGVLLVTGDNTIQTKDGTLLTKDAIVLSTGPGGEFAEVDTVVGGTGEWAGATGTLTATGTFVNGVGEGLYSGEICVP